MEAQDQTSVEKKKTITLKQVCAWIVGGLLMIAGIGYLEKSIVSAAGMFLSGAIVLPPTYAFLSKRMHTYLSGWLRATIATIILVMSAIAGTTDTQAPKDIPQTTETVTHDIANATPIVKAAEETKVGSVIQVSSPALVAEFKENGVAAAQKYAGKRIRVTGVVHSVDRDIMDNPYVVLAGDQYGINNVQCMFPKEYASGLVSLKKDTRATVEGVFSSNLINVLLNYCTVVIK